MHLKIGVITLQPGWTLVLDQIGVWWEAGIDWECDLNQQYSLIIVNAPLAEAEYFSKLETYLEKGGAVIDQGYVMDSLEDIQFGRTFKKTFYPESTEYYTPHEPIDIYRNIWLHPNGALCEGAVYTQQYNKGMAAFVGWEINPLMLDERASYKYFQHDGHPPPFERVSLVSKSEIRRFLFGLMRWLHISRNIPFVHKWMFPGLSEQLFLFRVDTDFGTKDEISALSGVTKSQEIPATWFLHVEAHEKWLADFPHAINTKIDELAAHGYEHKATRSFSFNEHNIQKAVDQLQLSGIQPDGFAVPYGYWNPALAKAIASFTFSYSSEFALSYNHYPYFVESYDFDVPLLQIPVHPVCIGSFRRTKVSQEAMLSYFMDVIERFEAQHEPVALYHHPKDGHHHVLEEIFRYVHKKTFRKCTFQAYATWWKKRHQHSFKAEWDGDQLEIERQQNQPEIAICSHDTMQQASLWIEHSAREITPQKDIAFKTPQTRTVEQQKKLRGFKPRLIKQVLLDLIYRP